MNNDFRDCLKFINEELGSRIVNVILSMKRGEANKLMEDPGPVSDSTRKLVASLCDVTKILRSALSRHETRLWIVDHSEFLYGVPALEIRSRPEDVRMAAQNRVARGEYWEMMNRLEKS